MSWAIFWTVVWFAVMKTPCLRTYRESGVERQTDDCIVNDSGNGCGRMWIGLPIVAG